MQSIVNRYNAMDINYLGYAGPGGEGGHTPTSPPPPPLSLRLFEWTPMVTAFSVECLYILLTGSWVQGGPGCLGIWVRGGPSCLGIRVPPDPKWGGGGGGGGEDPYACDTVSTF